MGRFTNPRDLYFGEGARHEVKNLKGSKAMIVTGGGSMLRGLAGYIAGELHVDVAIAPDPINCVARGTAASLTLGQYLTAGFRDATPRAWHNRLQSPEGFSN